ncbi:unnamed protein product [Penicillium olsonii]|uniref:Sister chromatid cohesion and DNA repair protein (BimD) n=1 Tax=Penicillium olsonii TaxID=99116 RepID=A0A9W4HPC1_PENOL|nr:unnamed protein product [Penicillium olsonii]
MPLRSRQGPPEVVEDSGLRSLSFNQPLSWRVGRSAIPIADLLERLRSLAQELRKLDQEEIDKESLRKVSQELASGNLLAHKDKGVRAWATCCIVDVLRLCAPDAPFTRNQLKDTFTCIVSSIIPALADPSNAYNAQHIYVLGSLAEVKSVVLMVDLDHPDSLIVPLFAGCFDIVSGSSKASTGEEVAKNVEFDMTRVLVTVIDESLVLAPEVVDIIVAQFLRVDPRVLDKKGKRPDAPVDAKQDTLLLKDYPAAYNMAKAICQACPERMTSHISQYFNNVIIDASVPAGQANGSKHGARKPNLDDSDEEGEDIKELSKAHRLIRELWRACPEVLQNVIPQIEAELSAESVALRLLATQTIGDLAAGIGVAGPPPPPPMDPTTYPPVSLVDYDKTITQPNVLVTPVSPKPFSQVHNSAYEAFLSRRLDKTPSVRAAWVTVVGRILLTSAGGSGLHESEEHSLVRNLASMLRDVDEKVRVAAVDTVGQFGYSQIVNRLSVDGGCSSEDSVLAILAERVKDRKPHVREHAMKILARMWAVAAGDIEQNTEPVATLLKDAPSKIFDAFYTNDQEIHVLIDRVMFETLLPLAYPPVKSKLSRGNSNQSQKQKEKDSQATEPEQETDVDKIRVRRILTLLRGLDEKARRVFFVLLARQMSMRSAATIYLEACEKYNGGVINKDGDAIKNQLSKIVDSLSKTFPDASRASADLWKFAKVHDRRSYQLLRFTMAAVSDYRTVVKATKELQRRVQSANNSPILETITPLIYRCGSLVFNRSHIPAIMSLSRTDENGLANSAQEMLKQISSQNPEVLEAQVQEMCKDLEAQAPKASSAAGEGSAEDILKACSGFAKKLPAKLPKERKFLQALTNHALYSSSPHAAKHAVSILMATADRRGMYAKDLVEKCVKKWTYGSDHFLTRLAALSQLNLLAPNEADEESDAIISIAVNQILLTNRTPEPDSDYTWSETADDETNAKEWALKIIVNRLRAKDGADNEEDFRALAKPVYETLNKLVVGEGEMSKTKDTPAGQKSRLRLLAAKSLLKLCAGNTVCDSLLTPADFNAIALVAQDPLLQVRSGFISHLKKKLVQKSHLSHRWYIVPCLLAFEPVHSLKESTLTWLRSRAAYFAQQAQASGKRTEQTMVMELIFSRLLSLLAYHPDYPSEDLDESTKLGDLTDFSQYILFYLSAVANEHNMSLVFHVGQRVKQFRDGITQSDEISTRLHTLSDLAQATVRRFADIYSQQHKFGGGAAGATNILQTYPGRMGVPSSLFSSMSSHREAQDVADKNFLPEEMDDLLDRVVRNAMKPKNTSAHSSQGGTTKKRKPSLDANGKPSATKKARKEKPARTPRKSTSSVGAKPKRKSKNDDGWSSDEAPQDATPASARRRSMRGTAMAEVSYIDNDSDDADEEMVEWDKGEVSGHAEGEEAEDEDEDEDDAESENEMQDDDKENGGEPEVSEASEKELTPPPKARGKVQSAKKDAKKSDSKQTTLPSRRSSRRG